MKWGVEGWKSGWGQRGPRQKKTGHLIKTNKSGRYGRHHWLSATPARPGPCRGPRPHSATLPRPASPRSFPSPSLCLTPHRRPTSSANTGGGSGSTKLPRLSPSTPLPGLSLRLPPTIFSVSISLWPPSRWLGRLAVACCGLLPARQAVLCFWGRHGGAVGAARLTSFVRALPRCGPALARGAARGAERGGAQPDLVLLIYRTADGGPHRPKWPAARPG